MQEQYSLEKDHKQIKKDIKRRERTLDAIATILERKTLSESQRRYLAKQIREITDEEMMPINF